MMYVKWLLLAILDIAFNIVCYLTNPIVVLFGSEYGNLPWLLTWWDNYDDCMDVEWFVKEGHVPSCCVYDYDKHYKFHDSNCYKDERKSFGEHHWDNFVGWKFQDVEQDVERCMLAFRITPFQ